MFCGVSYLRATGHRTTAGALLKAEVIAAFMFEKPPNVAWTLWDSPVEASAHEGTAHYVGTSVRVHTTNPPQQPESERREQRGVLPTPVQPAPIGHFPSCTVATLPDTAPLVDPSAFVAVLVGFAALPNPTLILCFHLFRSGLEDNERMTASL